MPFWKDFERLSKIEDKLFNSDWVIIYTLLKSIDTLVSICRTERGSWKIRKKVL